MHRDARIPCKYPKRLRHPRAVSFFDDAISLSVTMFTEHPIHVGTRRAAFLDFALPHQQRGTPRPYIPFLPIYSLKLNICNKQKTFRYM
jgi:hypothetical protein